MTQRIFAAANTVDEPDAPARADATARMDARARAAAYLDLWERHLMEASVHADIRPWRRGNGA